MFRKSFNPHNKIETDAIDIGNGREVYVFKHEMILLITTQGHNLN